MHQCEAPIIGACPVVCMIKEVKYVIAEIVVTEALAFALVS